MTGLRLFSIGKPGSFLILIIVVAIGQFWGCSSSQEAAVKTPATAGVLQDSAMTQKPSLPRLPITIDSLPPAIDVNLADQEALLDRARMHLVLASKSIGKGDTLGAVEQCNQAAERLDRAGFLPEIDMDSDYVELTRSLMSLYKLSANTIIRANVDVPEAVLTAITSVEIDTERVDLSELSFKEPPPTTIPLPLNEQVEKNIVYFSTKMRNHFAKWLERSGRYFPVMRSILKEEGLPDEIIFLTMIESGVNPQARSWAKCVGLWQFLKSTGEMYGLRGDWFFDDRRNPEKATRAAARHLRDLFNKFGDWHLALAAYNAGVGRIERAVARCVTKNPSYWDVQPLLPTETQNYVPRYIAAAIIALNQDAYDFTDLALQKPLEYDVVTISAPYAIDALAECVGLRADEFLEYNPYLLQNVTPPEVKDFEIRIPKGRTQTFASNIGNLKPERTTTVIAHKVKRRETIAKIARLYDVSVDQIKRANEMSRTRRLIPGEILKIPKLTLLDNTSYAIAMDNISSGTQEEDDLDPTRRTNGRERTTVKIEKGMTLGGIAARYKVTIFDLMTWNKLKSDDVVKLGRELVVWTRPGFDPSADSAAAEALTVQTAVSANISKPSPKIEHPIATAEVSETKASKAERYRVQKGESLASIASAFNVSVDNLKFWNRLSSSKVRSGKVLKIYKPVPAPVAKSSNPPAKPVMETVRRKETTPLPSQPGSHTVQSGETLWGISQLRNIAIDDLRVWNALKDDNLQTGQVLMLTPPKGDPVPAKPSFPERNDKSAEPDKTVGSGKSPGAAGASYAVVKGDNLWSISRTTGVSIERLIELNNIKNQQVIVGQVLRLTGEQEVRNAPRSADGKTDPAATPKTTYTVLKGDNLYSIARQNNISVQNLRSWNDLKDDNVKAGQILNLAGGRETVQERDPKRTMKYPREAVAKKYVVEDGDTFYGIARKLGVSISDLQEWNTRTRILKTGQELSYFSKQD